MTCTQWSDLESYTVKMINNVTFIYVCKKKLFIFYSLKFGKLVIFTVVKERLKLQKKFSSSLVKYKLAKPWQKWKTTNTQTTVCNTKQRKQRLSNTNLTDNRGDLMSSVREGRYCSTSHTLICFVLSNTILQHIIVMKFVCTCWYISVYFNYRWQRRRLF